MNNNIQNDQPRLDQTQQQIQQQTVQPLPELHPWDEAILTRNNLLNNGQPSVPDEEEINNQTNIQPQPAVQQP